ncbi:hypothetical protein SSX86_011152 [Deinandra increscens subsp. villosa]|uniref:F-box domain-containing protein n=1 Tax=Deinandra increscens subsp. villosa TaxID=3103831 RepID=A0AAP0D8W0_9ASTR
MSLKIVRQPTRNWLDLPSELTANILYRIGVLNILLSAQKVCTAWRKICKDPAMWTIVCIDAVSDRHNDIHYTDLCKHVVDRSQGQLVDITISGFLFDEIFRYIANRSSLLKRLIFVCCDEYTNGIWTECLKKFPLLEELSLYVTPASKEAIETAGRYCSKLKTLKVNQDFIFWEGYYDEEPITSLDEEHICDEIAMAIGLNLHDLRHLELIGNTMSNEGLEMILDGCHHLESLDLRACLFIDLKGDLGKRCLQQIKCLKLPDDSLEGCPYIYGNNGMARNVSVEGFESDMESEEVIEDESNIESEEEFDNESDE